jgi:polyphosphate kinase
MKKTAEPLSASSISAPQPPKPELKVPPPTAATPATAAQAEFNLDSPELYLNRELTLLDFNRRVLRMSEDELTPLLERVKFLAIVSSNLDEFFMKRIGGLKQQIAAGIRTPTVDGRTPIEQVAACQSVVRDIHQQQNRIYRELLGLLDAQGIRLVKYSELDAAKREVLRQEFITNIFPLLTPLALDPAHPFPLISNLALNLLVSLRHPGGSAIHIARVYGERKRNFVGQHFWARGFFVSTLGRDAEAIRAYIQRQEEEDRRQDQMDMLR